MSTPSRSSERRPSEGLLQVTSVEGSTLTKDYSATTISSSSSSSPSSQPPSSSTNPSSSSPRLVSRRSPSGGDQPSLMPPRMRLTVTNEEGNDEIEIENTTPLADFSNLPTLEDAKREEDDEISTDSTAAVIFSRKHFVNWSSATIEERRKWKRLKDTFCSGNPVDVEILLLEYRDELARLVTIQDIDGRPILSWAVGGGRLDIVRQSGYGFTSNNSYQNSMTTKIVKTLLEADYDDLGIRKKDRFGYLPIHHAISRRATPDIIQLLLQADDSDESIYMKTNLTGSLPLHLAVKGCSGDNMRRTQQPQRSSSINTTDSRYSIEGTDIDKSLSTIRMMKTIQLLIDADKDNQTILTKDNNEHLPLHVALQNKYIPIQAIKVLVDADKSRPRISIREKGKSDLSNSREKHLPIDIALQKHAPIEIVDLLLDADEPRHFGNGWYFKETMQGSVVQMLLTKYPISQRWMDRHLSAPLLRIILDPNTDYTKMYNDYKQDSSKVVLGGSSRQPNEVLSMTVESHPSQQQPTNEKEEDLSSDIKPFNIFDVPVTVYPFIATSITKSEWLQAKINTESSKRHVVIILLADFYANIALIGLFYHASKVFLNLLPPADEGFEGDMRQYPGHVQLKDVLGLYLLAGWFLVREIIQLISQHIKYFTDVFNIFDWARLILTVTSAIYMQTGRGDEQAVRTLLAWTGGFVFLGLISFLRLTFLPFSNFVSGTLHIVGKLLPFFIVSFLVLSAFSYMFYVADTGIDSIKDGFFQSYAFFVGSVEGGVNDFLDVFCGLVISVIFLTVVIAIVTQTWTKRGETVSEDFWKFRLRFLTELRSQQIGFRQLEHTYFKSSFTFFKRYLKKIDKIGEIKVLDRVHWWAEPYYFIKAKEEYDDPSIIDQRYLLDLAGGDEDKVDEWCKRLQTEKIHSFERDWYWARHQQSNFAFDECKSVILRFLRYAVIYFILLVLGVVSFGVLWPNSVRRFLFYGRQELKKKKANKDVGRAKDKAIGDVLETPKTKQIIIPNETEALRDELLLLKSEMKEMKNMVQRLLLSRPSLQPTQRTTTC